MADNKDQKIGVYFTNPPAKPSGGLLLDFWWWSWRLLILFAVLKLLSLLLT